MLRFLTTLTLTFLATPGLADTDLPDQATGAVAAIIVSIQLARSSARREREANEAATRRMANADRAAAERAVEADRAAETRIQRAKDEA